MLLFIVNVFKRKISKFIFKMYDNYIKSCLAECLGTFTLCLGVASGTFYAEDGSQRTHFILTLSVIFISVILNARLSGGDFNPGVTLTKYLSYEKEQKKHINNLALVFSISQCIFALISFLLYAYLTNYQIVFKLAIGKNTSYVVGFIVEFVASFFTYFFTILIDQKQSFRIWPLKILACVTAVATGMSIGCIKSGAGLNPAVGFGANMSRLIIYKKKEEIYQLWIFIFAPILAAFVASGCFRIVKKYYYLKI